MLKVKKKARIEDAAGEKEEAEIARLLQLAQTKHGVETQALRNAAEEAAKLAETERANEKSLQKTPRNAGGSGQKRQGK